jgi:hypothetical protein
MADDTGQPGPSGDEQRNPWAPPEDGVSLGKGTSSRGPDGPGQDEQGRQGQQGQQRQPVAEQPTIIAASGTPPPPPPPPAPSAPHDQGQAHGQQHGAAQFGAAQYGPGYGQSTHGSQQHGGRTYGSQQYGGQPYGQPPTYGYPAQPAMAYGYGPGLGPYGWPVPPLPTGKSVASMVLGIISLVAVSTCWGSFLGIITSPIALGLGLSARRAVDRGELGGRGQAVAGFVMGIVGIVLSAIIITLIVLTFTVFKDELKDQEPGSGGGGSSIDARGSVSLVVDSSANRLDPHVR